MIYKKCCRLCKKEFTAKPRQFICSSACKTALINISRKKWADKNREIIRMSARKKWQRPRECRYCKKVFGAIHANQRLCSFKCKAGLFAATPWLIEGKRVRGRKSFKAVRAELLSRQKECLACGSSQGLTIDHIKPLSAGGGHEKENLQVLCRPCNARKYTSEIRYGL